MARRKKIHGRRRKRSPLKSASIWAKFSGAPINGAIGGADKTKAAADKKSEPNSAQEGEFITRAEARGLVNRSVKGQTAAQPKRNQLSESEGGAKEAFKTAKESSGGGKPSQKEILENAQKNFGANRGKWARASNMTASFM